jgi:ribosomal protein L29
MAARKNAKVDAPEAEVVKEVKKVTKKSTKKAETTVKAVKQSVQNLRELSETDLHAKLAELRKDLVTFHKMARANELPSSHVIKKTRRDIARVHTILTENLSKENDNE